MNTGWKVYAWFYLSFGFLLDVLVSFMSFSKYSIGDWVFKFLELLTVVALFAFAYQKPLVKQIVWRSFFWVTILASALSMVYYSTSFRFLSEYLMPQYQIKTFQNAFSAPLLLWGIGIPCFVLGLPILYALFFLAYKKFKEKKVEKIPANASYSGLAIASFITGLVGLLLGPFLTIPALITGILGIRSAKKRKMKGAALAWIGIMIFVFHTLYLYSTILIFIYVFRLPGALNGYEEAVKHMNSDQLSYYNATIAKIKPNTSQARIEALLGKPDKVTTFATTETAEYLCPEKLVLDCKVTITRTDNTLTGISWYDLKQFMYNKTFTDADKVYMYDKYDVTLTLLPNWSEYVYSEKELKDYEDGIAPITFYRTKNNSGYLYVMVRDLAEDEGFEIRQVIKDLDVTPLDFKQDSFNGFKVYQFRAETGKEKPQYFYLIKKNLAIVAVYYVKNEYYNKEELDEALRIIKTIDSTDK